MLKWIIDQACSAGMHHGSWADVNPGPCTQARICGGCGAQSFRDKHRVADWVSGWGANTHYGVCVRCNRPQTLESRGGEDAPD